MPFPGLSYFIMQIEMLQEGVEVSTVLSTHNKGSYSRRQDDLLCLYSTSWRSKQKIRVGQTLWILKEQRFALQNYLSEIDIYQKFCRSALNSSEDPSFYAKATLLCSFLLLDFV